jgi:flagellar biosynthesis/type III secretory pathway protein FliH
MPEAVETIDLVWTPDPTMGRGGCLVETATSIVDGQLDRMLYDIYDRLGHD